MLPLNPIEGEGAGVAVWRKIKTLVDHVLGEDEGAGSLREDELRLAAAALLIHASMIDGHVDPEETKTLKALLQSRFAIDDDQLRRTLKEAEVWEHDSVDLYRFTSVLCRGLDQDVVSASSRCCGRSFWRTAWCTSSSRTWCGAPLNCSVSRPTTACD